MTSQGGGGGGIPGVTSDDATPGGEIIAGALAAGDPNAATAPSTHNVYGYVLFNEVLGNINEGDDVVDILQSADLSRDNTGAALAVHRSGNENGHSYVTPAVFIYDLSASTAPMLMVKNSDAVQFQVDGDGVRIHGKIKTGSSAAHSLGAYSGNSIPIYDSFGTLLGYMPLYD